MLLQNRVAIITGGSSGIGRAAAQRFAAEGAQILLADIDDEQGNLTVEQIRGAGGDALYVHTDVSNGAEVEKMAAAALERWGAIDILFNNAAATGLCNVHDRPVHELEEWVWDKMIAVTLKSVYLCSKFCLPTMMAKRSGVILNTTSIDAILAEPGFDAYTAAKGGIISLTRGMAAEYGPHNIRVNAISPGYVITECQLPWYSTNPQMVANVNSMHALGRCGQPQEVAQMALVLCSDLSSFVTGAIVDVDGGYTAFKQANADRSIRVERGNS